MKKTLGLIAILMLVASASAGIDIYLTRASQDNVMTEETRYSTDEGDYSYASNGGSYGYTEATSPNLTHCPFVQAPGTIDTYYIWAQITLEPTAAPKVAKVAMYGLDLRGSTITNGSLSGTTDPDPNRNDTGGLFYRQVGAAKRWEGVGPLLFTRDFCASTGMGVTAQDFGNFSELGWKESVTSFHFLLGVFDLTAGTSAGSLQMDTGVLYMAVREYHRSGQSSYVMDRNYATDPNSAVSFYPKASINGTHITESTGPVTVISWTPEPASMLLLGLAGLLIRRR